MTVEQHPLPRFSQPRSRDDHNYAKIREITGITDKHVIHQAINACKNDQGSYKVEEVVNMLITEEAGKSGPTAMPKNKVVMTQTTSEDAIDAKSGSKPAVALPNKSLPAKEIIDLTTVSDVNEDDIQKAIHASLQETQESSGILGGQVSREEQDISRVLEQSLIENKAGTKRKRGDIWFVDPLNPHERKRQDGWPIGLKNVGNTCWFSAVIQSLFHLRRFRHLVLSYQPPKDLSQTHPEERRNLRFMQELRHLFALMVGSQKKYVDPSRAVDILKEAFSSNVVTNAGVSDSQQDVSEFQHKLLEWLEDAFKSSSRPSSPAEGSSSGSSSSDSQSKKSSHNPMVDLFYGQYRADGFNEGKGFSNEENFGQFPLQVNGFRDIHESLEATTAHKEIESINDEATQKSGQELWFTRLPPVLTFELSRFQFNQQLGRPEKIHNKIEFPPVIYMDRYMDFNRERTRERREKAKKLKEELLVLQAKLDKFINYGSGSKRFPLQDVLLYALEFAKSRKDSERKHPSLLSQDVDMESPSPNTSMLTDSPVKSPPDIAMVMMKSPPMEDSADVAMTSLPMSPTLPTPNISMPTNVAPLSNTPPDVAMATAPKSPPRVGHQPSTSLESPGPRHVSVAELHILQDCLQRWRKEVESDVMELQENIGTLEDSINKMYSDELMTKFPYHLHAVLVHEGQAASGHYWAYIYDMTRDHWLKFNDITVSEASWEELEKDSVGGYHNTSAYCLMYVDKTRIAVKQAKAGDDPSLTSDFENLPDDLKEIVATDNKAFAEEIEKWDRDLARRTAGGGDADAADVATDPKAGQSQVQHQGQGGAASSCTSTVSTQTSRISPYRSSIHARLSEAESTQAIRVVLETDVLETKGGQEAVQLVLQNETKRLQQVVAGLNQLFPLEDPRLQHIMVYLIHCQCPCPHTLKRILLEQFVNISIPEQCERATKLRLCAVTALDSTVKESTEETEKHYKEWHETYQTFYKVALLFIRGVESYLQEKFEVALPYLVHAHSLNMWLEQKTAKASLSDMRISSFFLRQCLLHLNDTITQHFEERSEVDDLLSVMNSLVLPCLPILLKSGYQDDITAAEEIREKWCTFLGQDLEAHKVEKLQDFLSKLFEPSPDLHMPDCPSVRNGNFTSLAKQYRQVMAESHKSGYLERALKSS